MHKTNNTLILHKCPFCKGHPKRSSYNRPVDNRAVHIVVCGKCSAQTNPALTPITAENRWQRRK